MVAAGQRAGREIVTEPAGSHTGARPTRDPISILLPVKQKQEIPMNGEQPPGARRHAFYLRLWQEGHETAWRGSIQQAGTEQVRYFQHPGELTAIIQELCAWSTDVDADPDAQP
jgi:hypothetical protein